MWKRKRPRPIIPESMFDHENWGGKDDWNFKKEGRIGGILFKIFIVAVFIGFAFVLVISSGQKIVVHKCITLEEQSKEFKFFFVTYWEKEMCDESGFTFAGSKSAPVRVNTLPEGEGLDFGVWYMDDLGKWKAEVN